MHTDTKHTNKIFYCPIMAAYLFIEHVRMLCEPHAEALEGSHDHGV